MSDRSHMLQIVEEQRPSSHGRLHIEIAPPRAKVILLPGRFRGPEYIRTHVSYVVKMDAEQGEQHIVRNLGAIEDKLRELGVNEPEIASELRSIEGAVRAELWRQVLLPEERQ